MYIYKVSQSLKKGKLINLIFAAWCVCRNESVEQDRAADKQWQAGVFGWATQCLREPRRPMSGCSKAHSTGIIITKIICNMQYYAA